jgi:dienelactone hydrolase
MRLLLFVPLLATFLPAAEQGPPQLVGGANDAARPGVAIEQMLVLGAFPADVAATEPGPRLRSWALIATDHLASVGGEAGCLPQAGAVVVGADGDTRVWTTAMRPSATGTVDVQVDLGRALTLPKGGRVLYAAATLPWPRDEDAVLTWDATDDCVVRVNGAVVAERTGLMHWPRDEAETVAVRLRAGDNRILFKMRSGFGMRIMAHVIPRHEAEALPVSRLRPRRLSVQGDGSRLEVLPDAGLAALQPGRMATVEVVAPGGRVIERRTAPLDHPLAFDASAWPAGPGEIRVRSQDPSGELVGFVPWFRGDIRSAVTDLLAMRPAEDDLLGRFLCDAAKLRLGKADAMGAEDLLDAAHHLLLERADVADRAVGGIGGHHPYGFARLAWRAANDGSPQYAAVRFPRDYDPSRRWPLVAWMHGNIRSNPPYAKWSDDRRHAPMFLARDAIIIEPFGRGNLFYWNAGENDVLQCLDVASRDLSIDPDRVSLSGFSMGGRGALAIAARHPQRFAGTAPGGSVTLPTVLATDLPPWEAHRRLAAAQFLEPLWATPVFLASGARDARGRIDEFTAVHQQLTALGYPVRWFEVPDIGHELMGVGHHFDGPGFAMQLDALLAARRVAAPLRAVVRTVDLSGGRSHWLEITRRNDAWGDCQADAALTVPGTIRIASRGVLGIRLHRPLPGEATAVVWNGRRLTLPSGGDPVDLADPAAPVHVGFVKTARRSGPVERVLAGPFTVVVGTAGPATAAAAQWAEAFAKRYATQFHTRPPLLLDREVDARIAGERSLILVGTQQAGTPAGDLRARIDLGWIGGRLRLLGRDLGPRSGAMLVQPHPGGDALSLVAIDAVDEAGFATLTAWSGQGMGGMWRPSFMPAPEFDWLAVSATAGAPAAGGILTGTWQWSSSTATDELAPPQANEGGSRRTDREP